MRWRRPRFGIRSLLILVALIAVTLWGVLVLVSPTRWLERRLQRDSPAYARVDAVGALGQSGRIPPWEVDRAVSALIRALDDPDPMVRGAALVQLVSHRGLAQRGDATVRALPAVVDRLGDESGAVRGAAASALGILAAKSDDGPMRSRVEDALIGAVEDPDPLVRVAASLSLLDLDREHEAVGGIVEALTGADELARNAAAGHLWRRGSQPPVIVAAILGLLEGGRPEVARAVLPVVVQIAPPDAARRALERAATGPDAETRAAASAMLERLGIESPAGPVGPR